MKTNIFNLKRTQTLLIPVLFFLIVVFLACKKEPLVVTETDPETEQIKLFGLNFSPYMNAQDPNMGVVIPKSQIASRMSIIAPYTNWIKTFGCTHGLEHAAGVADSLGLNAAIGAWLSNDLNANNIEIENLIQVASTGKPEMLVVGSEVLLRNDLTEQQLIDYINFVKSNTNIPVAYSDVYSVWFTHPALFSVVDKVLVNYYPYWEGMELTNAISAINGWHTKMCFLAGNKEVIVSETGWPTAGNSMGAAVPSLTNTINYLRAFLSWAKANNVNYFLFSAFDEAWKAAHEGPQGSHWGMWDENGTLKNGMSILFTNDSYINDNWTSATIPGGPFSTPEIIFTYVPPVGSNDNLKGQIWHRQANGLKVVVYIYVGGKWWIKPYSTQPVIAINENGSWVCDITTGGVDAQATKIAAYLINSSYAPPILLGSQSIPQEIEDNCLAKVLCNR